MRALVRRQSEGETVGRGGAEGGEADRLGKIVVKTRKEGHCIAYWILLHECCRKVGAAGRQGVGWRVMERVVQGRRCREAYLGLSCCEGPREGRGRIESALSLDCVSVAHFIRS